MTREIEEPVELAVARFIRDTDKAILVELADSDEEVWLPRSQIEDIDRMEDGTGLVTVSRWLAREKGLVDE